MYMFALLLRDQGMIGFCLSVFRDADCSFDLFGIFHFSCCFVFEIVESVPDRTVQRNIFIDCKNKFVQCNILHPRKL